MGKRLKDMLKAATDGAGNDLGGAGYRAAGDGAIHLSGKDATIAEQAAKIEKLEAQEARRASVQAKWDARKAERLAKKSAESAEHAEKTKTILGKLDDLKPDSNINTSIGNYERKLDQLGAQLRNEGGLKDKRTLTKDMEKGPDDARYIRSIEYRVKNKKPITENEFLAYRGAKVKALEDNKVARMNGKVSPVADHPNPTALQQQHGSAKGAAIAAAVSGAFSWIGKGLGHVFKPDIMTPGLKLPLGPTPGVAFVTAATLGSFGYGLATDNDPTRLNVAGRIANFLTDMPFDGDDTGIYGERRFVNEILPDDIKRADLEKAVTDKTADPILREQWLKTQGKAVESTNLTAEKATADAGLEAAKVAAAIREQQANLAKDAFTAGLSGVDTSAAKYLKKYGAPAPAPAPE